MKLLQVGALAALLTVVAAPMTMKAQTDVPQEKSAELMQQVRALEREVVSLRAEVEALKQQKSAPAAAAAAPTSQTAVVSTASPSAASSLLGGASFSGFVDTYYGYNFNQPQSQTNTLRSFDGPSNQFALNLIELNLDKPPDPTNSRLGYHIGLGIGQAMNVVNSTDPAGLGFAQYLKEAYISYLAPVGKGLQMDVGKFVTPYGAEVIETKDNFNYSRGLLFGYAIPFYHFGLRAKYSFNDKYSVTGLVVNGWNDIYDNNTGKSYGVVFGWNPTKKISFAQGYMAGPETVGTNAHWRQLSDTVVTYSPTGKLTTMLNFDYGRGDRAAGIPTPVFWTGIAGYVKYAFNGLYAVATRYEYYNDHDGFTTGTPQHLNEFTGTFERIVAHHLITRVEFRRDFSNRPVFTKGTTPVMGQNTMAAGLVYSFDSREIKQ
jgi:Putative beta-barrel porin-2, OmpL-like. bbp2